MSVCRVFNIERFATEDGHGIRTVVFLKGCGLKCLWCANPESQSPAPQILVKTNVCISCGRCRDLCPRQAISEREGFGYITDEKLCNLCGTCIKECYAGARELLGYDIEEDTLIKEVLKDEAYFRMSGGGITFSGGEPLLYYESIRYIARRMKERGINTLVETCGQAPKAAYERIYKEVESVYFDFKQIDSGRHRRLTGKDNSLILENLEWLCDHYKGHLTVRYPYIPGCNDDEQSIGGFLQYISQLQNVEEIIFLPYHRLGYPKYQGLGRTYEMGDMPSLKKMDLAFLIKEAEKYGVKVKIQ